MRKLNNRKVFIFGLIILTLANLGFVISVFFMRQDINEDQELNTMRYPRHFMHEEIGFSDEQLQQFHALRQEYREMTVPIHREIRKLNHELVVESTIENPDSMHCNAISRQIGDLHAQLKMITSMHLTKVRSIAHPDQIEKLQEMYLGIFNADGYGPGRGNGNGKGNGSGSGNGMRRQHRHGQKDNQIIK